MLPLVPLTRKSSAPANEARPPTTARASPQKGNRNAAVESQETLGHDSAAITLDTYSHVLSGMEIRRLRKRPSCSGRGISLSGNRQRGED